MNLATTATRPLSVTKDARESSPESDYEQQSTDYVKWQGSQTACLALNQLIKSSTVDDPKAAENGSQTSRGWQRQPSFDQIPGFSLLSTKDTLEFSPQASSFSSSASAKPVRPSLARPRLSNTTVRAPEAHPDGASLDLDIPFLNKANPASFLDLLKGVSAHLDKNVSVAAGKSPVQGQGVRAAKRPRHSSFGGTIEAPPGNAKRGRVSAPVELEGNAIRALDKGKTREVRVPQSNETDEPLFPAHVSVNAAPSSTHASDIMSPHPENLPSRIPHDQKTLPKHPLSSKTASQSKMPPPALPSKHLDPAVASRNRPSTSSSITPTTSTTRTSFPIPRNHTTIEDSKPSKPEPTPKLHPLLLSQQQSKAAPSSQPPKAIQAHTSRIMDPKPNAPLAPALKTRPPSSQHAQRDPAFPTNSQGPSASQSARPPALGMRRTAAAPAAPAPAAALPTKRKGFKPPLLSASQAQPAPASQPTVRAAPALPTCSGGSTSSESLRASSGSSAGSGSSVPLTASPSPQSFSRVAGGFSRPSAAVPSAKAVCIVKAEPKSASTPAPACKNSTLDLPEPLDGDADSSFGDMSFDMDALEETMRMYD